MKQQLTTGEFRGLMIALALMACAIIAVAIVRGCSTPTLTQSIPADSIQAVITSADTTTHQHQRKKRSSTKDKKTKPNSSPRKPINRPSPLEDPTPVLPR